ncbi:MAG TPA: molybdate ABC transporter substrate-binding protein [Gemmatimonadota bacterium]|nr:molybdate ABC transporter substrate-binding protein [Gemmatimonadota bacterium]
MTRGGRAAVLALAGLFGCRAEHSADAVVLAAASLAGPFTELAVAHERAHPGSVVVLEFAASSTLAAQVRAGAPFDVLATADERTMAEAWLGGRVRDPTAFATNRLVVIVPRENLSGIRGIEGLARPGVAVVLAHAGVPAGAYARRALLGLGIADEVEANVVSNALDVKAVAAAVAMGEADAGIVYVTDLTPELRQRVRTFPLPARVSVRALYPIALASEPEHPVGARAFVDLVRSEAGRGVLAAHGFGPP